MCWWLGELKSCIIEYLEQPKSAFDDNWLLKCEPTLDVYLNSTFLNFNFLMKGFLSIGNKNSNFLFFLESFMESSYRNEQSSGFPFFAIDYYFQARIAQLVEYRLGTGVVPGSNPGIGENSSLKISNWIS